MSCVVAGLRYYFRIYKYEYLGELMTSELHTYIHTYIETYIYRDRYMIGDIFGNEL